MNCPRCSQAYQVLEAQIHKTYQNVRCSACQYSWKHDFSVFISPVRSIPAPLHRSEVSWVKKIIALFVLSVFLFLGIYHRDHLRQILPQYGAYLYDRLSMGLRSKGDFFLIEDLRIQSQKKDGKSASVVRVSGKLINMTDQQFFAPSLKISTYGSCSDLSPKQRIVNFFKSHSKTGGLCLHQRWMQSLQRPNIQAYEKVNFSFPIVGIDPSKNKILVHP